MQRSRLWLTFALLCVLLRGLPNLTYPIGRAQATYGVVAQGLLRGARLYRDIWDIKPPAIFWVYEGIVKLFGPVMWSVGAVDIVWLLAISWCIFRFAERYLGTAEAVSAVVLNASWHCHVGYLNAVHPETFLILFVFLAYFQVWREGLWPTARHFVAGLLIGVAFWFKYNALAFLPFLLLVPNLDLASLDAQPAQLRLTVPWRVWLRKSLALFAGLGATMVGVLGYFRTAGLWNALLENLEIASRYGASPFHHWGDYWFAALGTTVHVLGWGGARLTVFMPALSFVTALVPVVAFLAARKAREQARLAPVLLGGAFGCASIAAQVYVHTYAFELCYAFFAMAGGYLAVKVFKKLAALKRDAARSGTRLDGVLASLVLANLVLWPLLLESLDLEQHYRQLAKWSQDPAAFYANYPDQHQLEHLDGELRVIHLLREESSPGDEVYVWGAAALIYYLTGMRSPARFVPNFPLMSAWGSAAWREELVRDLRRSPPAFVVVARNDEVWTVTYTHMDSEGYLQLFPALRDFIADSYQPAADYPDFIVYRRTR